MEMVRLQLTTSEVKKIHIDLPADWLHMVEEKVSVFEHQSKEMIQSEEQREKMIKNEQSLSDLWKTERICNWTVRKRGDYGREKKLKK